MSRQRVSAGILLYRRSGAGLEVLLAHPGGPYFARKDAGAWTIPKGEPEADGPELGEPEPGGPQLGAAADQAADEELLRIALREFAEETGHVPADGPTIDLGTIVQKGGKVVRAWALPGNLDPSAATSNSFELEWPPRSGRRATFPEVDRVAWFGLDEAHGRIRSAQAPLLDRLAAALEASG